MTPLLGELRQGDLVGNIEALTRSAAQAAADITRLQGEVHFLSPLSVLFVLLLVKSLRSAEAACYAPAWNAWRTDSFGTAQPRATT